MYRNNNSSSHQYSSDNTSSSPMMTLCTRCGFTVYPVDRIGPLKTLPSPNPTSTYYHPGCFKCLTCSTRLSLRTYYHSQHDSEDPEVYCISHVPKPGPGHLDGSSVGIRSVIQQKNGQQQVRNLSKASSSAYQAEHYHHEQKESIGNENNSQFGRFDASALHIAHALRATQLQKAYKKEKPIHYYLPPALQTALELRHRQEEDDLYNKFAMTRAEEEAKIQAEFKQEWERELEKLASKFESLRVKDPAEVTTVQKLKRKEREDLEKFMTLKKDKKEREKMRVLLEKERAATLALVEKQSQEMIHLINEKKREMRSKIPEDEDFEEIEEYPSTPPEPRPPTIRKSGIYKDVSVFEKVDRGAVEVASSSHHLTFTDLISHLTTPCTSDVEKARSIFRWITVKNLNQMDFSETLRSDTPLGLLRGIKQGTESYHVLFKRLCSYAGLHCVVIKGWSKSAGYQPGVKFNDNRFRNSWNAVWVGGGWRFVQCNWGARHLVNAKDRQHHQQPTQKSTSSSDSLRYEYDDHYFLTDPTEFIYEFYPQSPEWQLLHRPITLEEFEELPFVRSLFFRYGLKFVSNSGHSDGGYFEIEGQGDSELSLRSPGCKAVVETDESGASTISLSSPPSISSSLIFHYNLKLYDSEAETFDGISLKRFVMQSVSSSPTAPIVSFRVHAPSSGAFLLDIFANAVTPKEYLTGEPMKFKSVCKVKILCAYLSTVMVPLPNTASGEWGPAKATRLFGLIPITHPDPLVFAGRELVIQFRMSRALTDFMGTLHKNGSDEKKLSRSISTSLSRDVITFTIHFPEEGQYGLDIYTRENDDDSGQSQSGDNYNRGKQLLTHCCKYLINSSKKNV